jgi:hypothetical protein
MLVIFANKLEIYLSNIFSIDKMMNRKCNMKNSHNFGIAINLKLQINY